MIKKIILSSFFAFSIIQYLSAQIDFKPYQTFITGSQAVSLTIDDINNDGLDDIALTTGSVSGDPNNYKLFIYYQNSNGTLDNPVTFPFSPDWPDGSRSIDVADLNNDSKKDIVIADNDSISVFYQINQNNFTRQSYYSGPSTDAVKTGDLNNDGLADIAVSHNNATFIKLFYQDTLGNLNPVSYPSAQGGLVRFEIIDMNSDLLNDLVFFSTAGTTHGLYFYQQNTSGGLNLPFSYSTGLTYQHCIAIGDLNNDLKNDIAISDGGNYPANLCILINNGNSFQFSPPIMLTAYDIPGPILIHDLNCDGKKEIIIAHSAWGALSFFEQNQNGQYNNCVILNNTYGIYKMYSIDIGDLNGDGMPDVALASGNLIIHYNDSKPIASDTVTHNIILHSDTTNYSINQVIHQIDTLLSYIVLTTDSVQVNNIVNYLFVREYHYEMHEGYICGNHIKDSILIDSVYTNYQNILYSDTLILSHAIDTLYSGIEMELIANNIKIIPNPNDGRFIVRISGINNLLNLKIFDLLGIQVLSLEGIGNGDQMIDLKDNYKGVYFLVFKNDNELISKIKLIKL